MRYLVLIALLTSTAAADDAPPPAMGKMVDKVVGMTNEFLDHHVDLLTYNMLHVRVDAEHRAARIAVGGGDDRVLTLRVAEAVEMVDGTARIKSRVALAVAGKRVNLALPNVEVAPSTFPSRLGGDRTERGVEVRLPLVRRSF